MALIGRAVKYVSRRRWLEITILLLLVLAYTLPFIRQAVHVDAQLDIDWARQELQHPLWQHIPDYDYFGYHYDAFHDTHPRLESLYLSLFLRLNGGEVSETLLHLAMIPFPLIAAVSMYFMARRFKVNAFIAALLLLISPAFLVNSHLIMKDIPGISLWLAGLAFFIAGVDRDRFLYMILGGISLTLSSFIFYQGLSAIPLALLYLVLQRRFGKRPLIALSIPVIAFAAYVSAHLGYYSALPTIKYPAPIGLPFNPRLLLLRSRGVITVIGGGALLPVLGVWLFPRSKPGVYTVAAVYTITTVWIAKSYLQGEAPVEHLILMPLMMASGSAIVLSFIARFATSIRSRLKGLEGGDDLFLSVWFLGVWFYCSILLPYASPRFMIPLLPPLVIITARLMAQRWQKDKRIHIRAVSLIAITTLALSLSIAVAEHLRAASGREQAQWVAQNIDQPDGVTVWYSGYLGFQFYLEQYGDYRMLIVNRNEPAKGDIIVESVYNGRWPFREELKDRIELIDTVDFGRKWPVNTFYDSNISWIGVLDVMLPYGFSGAFTERLYVYRITADPAEPDPEAQAELLSRMSEGLFWQKAPPAGERGT